MKIKGLIIGSLLTTLAITAYAQVQSQAFTQNCAQNPDLFLTINSSLPSNVTLTQMQSFFQVNGSNSPANVSLTGASGTTPIIVGFANSACLRANRVFSVGIGVQSLTSNVQAIGGVPITSLIASAQPTPGIGVTPNLATQAQPAQVTTVQQLPTTTLPVNCSIVTSQIQRGRFVKNIVFDTTTQTYSCN